MHPVSLIWKTHFLNLHVCPLVHCKDLVVLHFSHKYNPILYTVKCNILVYAHDTCLVSQHIDINEIEK